MGSRLVPILAVFAALSQGCRRDARDCGGDTDCDGGWTCADSVCRKMCSQHDDCWPPDVICAGGVCMPVPPIRCTTDVDCMGLDTANGCSTQGVCVCAGVGAPCAPGAMCSANGCAAPPPGCVGKCVGADDGVGGTCTANDCVGCCTDASACIPAPAQSDAQCGSGGALCADCVPATQGCDTTVGACVDPCTLPTGGCLSIEVNTTRCATQACGAEATCEQTCTPVKDCYRWVTTEVCPADRACQGSGCCEPSCTGKCSGTDDGCGGVCPTSGCDGCCDASHVCVAASAQTQTQCGALGADCSNCTLLGGVCWAHACCVVDCANKCAGADNGCGGTCSQNTCTGCCAGTACIAFSAQVPAQCGRAGAVCAACGVGRACYNGTCCYPSCSGKCIGASDTCGGTCTVNRCSGCCSTAAACVSSGAQSNTQCGSGGAACTSCTAISKICYGAQCCPSWAGSSCVTTCTDVQAGVRGYSQFQSVWCNGSDQSLYTYNNCSAADPDPCTTSGQAAGCGLIAGYQWCDVYCLRTYSCYGTTGCDGYCY